MTMKRVTILFHEKQRREIAVHASESGLGLSAFIRKVFSEVGYITPDAELIYGENPIGERRSETTQECEESATKSDEVG